MYDKVLEVFRETADCGSFSKAAERLYLTHTAVIKQLNSLEGRMGVRLLERSNHGVTLTPAGEVFYREAVEIMGLSKEAVRRVRSAGRPERVTLRIGDSALSPCRDFMEQWQQRDAALGGQSRFRLQIVPFSDDQRRYEHLGADFDFLVGPYDNPAMENKCRFFPIGRYRFGLLMNREHRLAQRKSLALHDLRGETVSIMISGISPVNDGIRQALSSQPQVMTEDIRPVYNMDTFNRCAESGALLLSPDCWDRVHPALAFVPLQEDFSIAYGVIAARKPGWGMEEFLEALRERFLMEGQFERFQSKNGD